MSAQPAKPGGTRSIVGPAGGTGSLLLEKTRVGPRRATPDSEALASSDDEVDKRLQDHSHPQPLSSKPPRRSSWLSDVQSVPARKSSVVGTSSISPHNSQPSTPATDTSTWPPAVGRAHTAATFPWAGGIWNAETRKEPPSRLAEVLPSPTSDIPPTWGSAYEQNDLASPPAREPSVESTIPFAIPLHPTPKSYRSQSYSVGQLDPDHNGAPPGHSPSSLFQTRVKTGQPSGLQHRPSRPSMLSELSHETTSLSQVREAEDDADDDSLDGSLMQSSDASALERLTRENALLRQAAATNQLENLRLRSRAASSGHATSQLPSAIGPIGSGHRIPGKVMEESDYAVDEPDDLNELQSLVGRGISGRRFSEFGPDTESRFSSFAFPEHRKIENLKKGQWQSSLGFGGLGEGQQSRRHSFADVPARNGSVSSAVDHLFGPEAGEAELGRAGLGSRGEQAGRFADGALRPTQGDAVSYFGTLGSNPRNQAFQAPATQAGLAGPLFPATTTYGPDQSRSPLAARQRHGLMHPNQLPLSQPRQNQLLCVVTFKCCRSDVFYVQEGTGLQVKNGDMVIVEADRGTDLGTVVGANVTWERAKELKEHYAEEHYKWLLMFSRHSAQGANGLDVTSAGSTSAVGGMGPQTGSHHGAQDTSGELRPKMIKRLAQNHEIQTLREKEGNEAKAKRVCQQKVAEHRLQMEILDAEFQMDWKKLTFYYFADAYINFNSLVTELFKVYKTRIWMSAINPASFAGGSPNLHSPSAVGNSAGALPFDRHSPYRPQHDSHQIYTSPTQFNGAHHPFVGSSDTSPVADITPTSLVSGTYIYPVSSLGRLPRQTPLAMADYSFGLQRQPDLPIEFRPVEFGDVRQDQGAKATERKGGLGSHTHGDPWLASFQGLSLAPH